MHPPRNAGQKVTAPSGQRSAADALFLRQKEIQLSKAAAIPVQGILHAATGPHIIKERFHLSGRKGNAGVRLLLCLNFHYVDFLRQDGRDPPFPIFPFTTESFFRGADKRPYADSVTKSILL